MKNEFEPDISISLVKALLEEQFPAWAALSIEAVEPGGWDNRTFRLGQQLTVRFPSAARYALQVAKEQEWLPRLAINLSLKIPEPVAQGKPSSQYPWDWSIFRWIEGQSANTLNSNEFQFLAEPLALWLKEFHQIQSTNGPQPGSHNFFRGGLLSVYGLETDNALALLNDVVDVKAARTLWEQASNSQWQSKPLWVHGDFSPGNMLVQGRKLFAVIDFGSMAVGDPACDLAIAWTQFRRDARKTFRDILFFDSQTWTRARGWALWKALITLAQRKEKSDSAYFENLRVVSEVLSDQW